MAACLPLQNHLLPTFIIITRVRHGTREARLVLGACWRSWANATSLARLRFRFPQQVGTGTNRLQSALFKQSLGQQEIEDKRIYIPISPDDLSKTIDPFYSFVKFPALPFARRQNQVG